MNRIKSIIWILKRFFKSEHYFIYSKEGMQAYNFPKEQIKNIRLVLDKIEKEEIEKINF